MTREEAKRRLLNIERCTPIHTREDVRDFEAIEMAIKALEQEQKSEWEHDHEILKAYSDGANDALDKIRAEIEQIAKDNAKSAYYGRVRGLWIALKIIDKYKAESEDKG